MFTGESILFFILLNLVEKFENFWLKLFSVARELEERLLGGLIGVGLSEVIIKLNGCWIMRLRCEGDVLMLRCN